MNECRIFGHYKTFFRLIQVADNAERLKYLLMLLDSKKGKAIPLQAWTGPEGSRKLRLPDFKKIGT